MKMQEVVVIRHKVKWGSSEGYHSAWTLNVKDQVIAYCEKLTKAYPDMNYRVLTLTGQVSDDGKQVKFADSNGWIGIN